jgi:hypothetical protein
MEKGTERSYRQILRPIVRHGLRELAAGANMEHVLYEVSLMGWFVGRGLSPREAIRRVESRERRWIGFEGAERAERMEGFHGGLMPMPFGAGGPPAVAPDGFGMPFGKGMPVAGGTPFPMGAPPVCGAPFPMGAPPIGGLPYGMGAPAVGGLPFGKGAPIGPGGSGMPFGACMPSGPGMPYSGGYMTPGMDLSGSDSSGT